MGRGGKREGAGRKPSPVKKEPLTTAITREAKATLLSLKARTGKSIAKLIEEMVMAMDETLRSLEK